MKRIIVMTVAVVGLGVVAGISVKKSRQPAAPTAGSAPSGAAATIQHDSPEQPSATAKTPWRSPVEVQSNVSNLPDSTTAESAAPAKANVSRTAQPLVRQAVDTLVSPQANFVQRSTVLDQLRNSGKLDQAIGDLEQRVADNPQSPECPAALGRAYLQKCGTLQDVREQGILAMKADQSFDAALNLDANNWDARFTKAVAMSYWPTQMNRGTEVMQHFVTLVEQQEAQSPQPQFAQTYLWLGKEYAKYGHAQEARDVWQRGAALFPNNAELRTSLGAQ